MKNNRLISLIMGLFLVFPLIADEGEKLSLHITNQTSRTVTGIFLLSHEQKALHTDLLFDTALMPKDSFTFDLNPKEFTQGAYTVYLMDIQGEFFVLAHDMSLPKGQVVISGDNLVSIALLPESYDDYVPVASLAEPEPVSAVSLGDFILINQTETEIADIRVSPVTSAKWGPNQINGQEPLVPGSSLSLYVGMSRLSNPLVKKEETNLYDFLLKSRDGKILYKVKGVDITRTDSLLVSEENRL